jgi:hypothetical protein
LGVAPLGHSAGSGDSVLSASGARIAVLRVAAREDIVIAEGAGALTG